MNDSQIDSLALTINAIIIMYVSQPPMKGL